MVVFHIRQFLRLIVPLLVAVRFTTLRERKAMGRMQRRLGPRMVGPWGLLQPVADGAKLAFKQPVIPSASAKGLYLGRPVLRFRTRILAWLAVPLGPQSVLFDTPYGMVYLFRVSRLEVYGIMFAGWSANSKYAFLGCLRSAAQMVSYEVCLGLIVLGVLLPRGTLCFTELVDRQQEGWLFLPVFPIAILYGIRMLAETNRAPFDLPEREAELVAGYNVEYGAMGFALFFLGEYRAMACLRRVARIVFFGGWLPPVSWARRARIPGRIWMGRKTSRLLFVYIWVRARFPRYRYDQLMAIGWQSLLPLSMVGYALAVIVLRLWVQM